MTFSVRGEPTAPINNYSTIPFSATVPRPPSTNLRIPPGAACSELRQRCPPLAVVDERRSYSRSHQPHFLFARKHWPNSRRAFTATNPQRILLSEKEQIFYGAPYRPPK